MSGAPLQKRGLSAAALKWIALITMTVDHFAASRLFEVLAFGEGMGWEAVRCGYMTMRLIGRLAFPIYCFLLTEGFRYTRSRSRYALRLGVFALISEIPFNLAVSGLWWDTAYQNVFFTLGLGLLALMFAQSRYEKGERRTAFFIVLIFALVAELLETDYGFFGVALIAVFHFLREQKAEKYLAGGVLLAGLGTLELAAVAAFVPIHFYDGRKGRTGPLLKWAFYVWYPVHLLAFGLAVRFLTGEREALC